MGNSYKKFSLMLCISFVVMYSVMFLNVSESSHVHLSLTRAYMSLLMVTPMAVLMMMLMPSMFPRKRLNSVVIISSILVFLLSLFMLRLQIPVTDRQYMKAMIPHHSSAILTSKNADIRDPEVRQLADGIIESQEREIRQMEEILRRMDDED